MSFSTWSLLLSFSHHYGNFSIIVIWIVPRGSSFSLCMNITVYIHIHTLLPPCRQDIYREVITPVNDGSAELEPIKAADMINSTPTLHTHTHRSVSIHVSSGGGLQKVSVWRACVCVSCMHAVMINFFWRGEKLIFLVTSCTTMWWIDCVHARVCAASVACSVCAKYTCSICALPCEHTGICLVGVCECVCLHANVEICSCAASGVRVLLWFLSVLIVQVFPAVSHYLNPFCVYKSLSHYCLSLVCTTSIFQHAVQFLVVPSVFLSVTCWTVLWIYGLVTVLFGIYFALFWTACLTPIVSSTNFK